MRVNDKNYIHLLKKKKESALYFVVDKYHPLVKGITLKVLSSLNKDNLIDECINDIYMQVWNNINKFHGENEDFKKWIAAIARFRAIDYYRKHIKLCHTSIEEIAELSSTSLEDQVIFTENKEELIECINSLGKPDCNIFIMKYFLGYNSQEIADKLSLTKASVDNRLSRGKKKLKCKLSNIMEVI